MMQMSLQSPIPGELECAPGLEYLPEDIQEAGLTKAIYRGYALIVAAIASILKKPGDAGVPTIENITAAIVSDRKQITRYFAKGGEILDALDFVVHSAMAQSPIGDGTWDEDHATVSRGEENAYLALPECANDLNWLLVDEKLDLPTWRYRTAVGIRNGTIKPAF